MGPRSGNLVDAVFFQRLDHKESLQQHAQPLAVEKRMRYAAFVAQGGCKGRGIETVTLAEARIARRAEGGEEQAPFDEMLRQPPHSFGDRRGRTVKQAVR